MITNFVETSIHKRQQKLYPPQLDDRIMPSESDVAIVTALKHADFTSRCVKADM